MKVSRIAKQHAIAKRTELHVSASTQGAVLGLRRWEAGNREMGKGNGRRGRRVPSGIPVCTNVYTREVWAIVAPDAFRLYSGRGTSSSFLFHIPSGRTKGVRVARRSTPRPPSAFSVCVISACSTSRRRSRRCRSVEANSSSRPDRDRNAWLSTERRRLARAARSMSSVPGHEPRARCSSSDG